MVLSIMMEKDKLGMVLVLERTPMSLVYFCLMSNGI